MHGIPVGGTSLTRIILWRSVVVSSTFLASPISGTLLRTALGAPAAGVLLGHVVVLTSTTSGAELARIVVLGRLVVVAFTALATPGLRRMWIATFGSATSADLLARVILVDGVISAALATPLASSKRGFLRRLIVFGPTAFASLLASIVLRSCVLLASAARVLLSQLH